MDKVYKAARKTVNKNVRNTVTNNVLLPAAADA